MHSRVVATSHHPDTEEHEVNYPQQPGQPPQGQPPQGQPAYGPPPPAPPAYGQAPMAPFPGNNEMTSRPPSKGTTIATAVLAILGTLFAIYFAISNFVGVANIQENLP